MKYEVKIKSCLLDISSALGKKDFKTMTKIQSEMADNIIDNIEYYNDFFIIYENAKQAPNKQFFNIMEDIIIKSGVYNKEELSNKLK